jgi:hypothetical protein
MLFATHVDVAPLAQNEQGQSGKNDKTNHNFPHTIFLKKWVLTRRTRYMLTEFFKPGRTLFGKTQSLA